MKPDFYTWPNPAFPFRLYYESNDLRIFIIENIFHNYDWLNLVKENIRPTDYFISLTGWHLDEYFAKTNARCLEMLNLNPDQFIILFNNVDEKNISERYGITGEIVNNNCWLDYNVFKIEQIEKQYDAVYIARPSEAKRHYLASDIKNLALAAGGHNHGNVKIQLPECVNDPYARLDRGEVNRLINSSRCGLILSENEGACYASSEYLLCGTPVVSTPSTGGRDYWYNEYNSVICQPTTQAVVSAVVQQIEKNPDPYKIREDHIRLMEMNRQKFKTNVLAKLIESTNTEPIDIEEHFKEKYRDKLKDNMRLEGVLEFFPTIKQKPRTPMKVYDYIEIGTCNFNTLLQNTSAEHTGISIEPVKKYLNDLPNVPGKIKLHAAITNNKESSTTTVYYIPDEIIDEKCPDKQWLKGCNSINEPHPLAEPHGMKEYVTNETVPLLNFQEIITNYDVNQVKHIKVDAEGHDLVILEGIINYISDITDEDKYPINVQIEHHDSQDPELGKNIMKMLSLGYHVKLGGVNKRDYIFERNLV